MPSLKIAFPFFNFILFRYAFSSFYIYGGHIIQAGPTPQLGDREHGDVLPQYGKVLELLRPLYPPLEELTYITDGFYDYHPQTRRVNIESAEKTERDLRTFFSFWMDRYSADVKVPPLFR